MNAMSDDSPKPTKAWELPDDATLQSFLSSVSASDPSAFSLDKVSQDSLGFYLFCKFCKQQGQAEGGREGRCIPTPTTTSVRACFLEEVVRYRRMVGERGRAIKALSILRRFLLSPAAVVQRIGEGLTACKEEGEGEEREEKVDLNEGDLYRIPNLSLSGEGLQACYEEAWKEGQDAQPSLPSLTSPLPPSSRPVTWEVLGDGGKEGEFVGSSPTSSSSSSSSSSSGCGGTGKEVIHLPPEGGQEGRKEEGGREGEASLLPVTNPHLNALRMGGMVKDEVCDIILRVARPLLQEMVAAAAKEQDQQQEQQQQQSRAAEGGRRRGGGGGGRREEFSL